ncbi:STT3 domain-containing protein [Methanobrevibacter sp.]
MNKETTITIAKSIVIIVILLAVVFALKVPAADLSSIPGDIRGEYTDASGLPYFSEMDSYYNLRLTEDYADHGFVGDEMINGSEWDMHRYAPTGNKINYELGIVYITNFLHGFFADHSLREVAFWTGAVVSTFAVIPAFIFARRLTNDYGAIVATVLIALAPNYFGHTFPGFFDTDMFYYILSLFFIFFFVECIRAKNIIFKVLFAVLSIISIGLFSQAWTGYIFYIGLMGIFSVVYLIACYIFNVGEDNQNEYSSKLVWFIHQNALLSILILGVIGFAGLAVFKGIDGVTGIFSSLLGLLSLQSASRVVGGFPNVLVSVAEMQLPNLLGPGMTSAFLASTNGVVNGIGGISILFTGLAVLYVLVKRVFKFRSARVKTASTTTKKPPKGKRKSSAKKIDDERKLSINIGDFSFGSTDELLASKQLTILYACLFVVWVVVTALAVSRGSRFITTIVLPFGLMAGIFVGVATDYIKNKLNNDNLITGIVFVTAFLAAIPLAQLNTVYAIIGFLAIVIVGLVSVYALKSSATTKVPLKKYVIIIALVLALISPTICGAYQTSSSVVPGTSDSMWNSMEWINQNTDNDTVITSWWDFGYLFEIAADRQVTFDGGSQSGDRAFWLGQAMTTSDVELSAGIFRMLDSTGTLAQEALINYTNSSGKATDILIDILPKTAGDAQNTLTSKYHLTADQAKNVVQYTHPDKIRPVIFVASSDMPGKAGWWTYFGNWNFDNQSSENFNYYVPTQQLEVKPGTTNKMELINDGGMIVNAVVSRGNGNNTTSAYTEAVYASNGEQIMINNTTYNPLNISKIIVIEDGYIMKNESVKGVDNANFTMLLMGNANQYTPILMSNELTDSMFTRLFFLGGANQNVFENVHVESGVMLFNVNFDNTVAGGASGSTGNSTNSTT